MSQLRSVVSAADTLLVWTWGRFNNADVWRPKLMFIDITQGAVASTLSLGTDPLPDHQYETVRHLLFGSLTGVRLTIQDLHKKHDLEGYEQRKIIYESRVRSASAPP